MNGILNTAIFTGSLLTKCDEKTHLWCQDFQSYNAYWLQIPLALPSLISGPCQPRIFSINMRTSILVGMDTQDHTVTDEMRGAILDRRTVKQDIYWIDAQQRRSQLAPQNICHHRSGCYRCHFCFLAQIICNAKGGKRQGLLQENKFCNSILIHSNTTLLLATLLRIVCEVLMTFRHENTKSQWYVTNSLGDGVTTFLNTIIF